MGFKLKTMQVALLSAFGAGIVVASPAVLAQATTEKLDRIEVTGSGIKRTDTETVSPVQVITRQEIERSGQPTVAELLRSVSANSGQSYNETFTNSFSPGASGVALRGLSQKNTLVLLNGRRVANYGFAQNLQDSYVDLNAIPISAVERVEILKDGASALYGSDAIAGVINVILRKDYQGAEASASFGHAYEGGMNEQNASAVIGIGSATVDKYNFLLSANYFRRDLVTYADRNYTNDRDDRRFGGLNNNSTGAGTYQRTTTAPTPNRVPFAACGTNGYPGYVAPITDFSTTLRGTACAYNPSPYLTLFPETKREQLVGAGTFQILPNLQAFTDLVYSHNNSFQRFTPTPFSSTSVAFSAANGVRRVPGTLPVGNPSNPYAVPTNISYTFFDVGGRDSDITSNFYRALGGLRGSLGKWDWETGFFHSQSTDVQHSYNGVNAFRLADVVADGSYNFVNPQLTPGVTNSLRANTNRYSTSKLDGVDGKVSTELFTLPAGPLGFAAGAEFKRESISDRPDALLTTGSVLGNGATETSGSRRTTGVYAEFNVPIVKGVEASLAAREDHYSDFGSAFSPKIGLRWQPVPELVLRTTASKGFRAPSLQENSKSAASFFTAVIDPLAQGGPAAANVAGVFAGNPMLAPERSKNYNAGFVVSPDSTSSIGLDFYSIEQKNLVASDDFQFIVDNPNLFPGQIIRDPVTGNLIAINSAYRNLTALRTSGYDLDFKKSVSLSTLGKLTLAGTWTYIQKYKQQLAAGEDLSSCAGSNFCQGNSFPRLKATTTLTWEYQAFTTALTYYYTGSYAQFQSTVPQDRVGEYRQYDAYLSWEGIKNLKIYGSVQNLANTRPPYDSSFSSGIDFTQYDARGRYFRAGLTYKFL